MSDVDIITRWCPSGAQARHIDFFIVMISSIISVTIIIGSIIMPSVVFVFLPFAQKHSFNVLLLVSSLACSLLLLLVLL